MFNTSSLNFPLNDLLYPFPQVLPGVTNNVLTFTALEDVMLAATFRMQTQEQANLQAKNILEAVGLKDRMFHLPNELTG